jgi:hypothetical protein
MSNDNVLYKKVLNNGIDQVTIELKMEGNYYLLFKYMLTDYIPVSQDIVAYQSTKFVSTSIIDTTVELVTALKGMGYSDE